MFLFCDFSRYECEYEGCGATYKSKKGRKYHHATHERGKTMACNFIGCRATFISAAELSHHRHSHVREEKPFKCLHTDCGAAYSSRQGLKYHTAKHTGDKPYKCEHGNCNAAFIQMGDLTSHSRTHGGRRTSRSSTTSLAAAPTRQKRVSDDDDDDEEDEEEQGEDEDDVDGEYDSRDEGEDEEEFEYDSRGVRTNRSPSSSSFSMLRGAGGLARGEGGGGIKRYKCAVNGCHAAFARLGDLALHGRMHTGGRRYARPEIDPPRPSWKKEEEDEDDDEDEDFPRISRG